MSAKDTLAAAIAAFMRAQTDAREFQEQRDRRSMELELKREQDREQRDKARDEQYNKLLELFQAREFKEEHPPPPTPVIVAPAPAARPSVLEAATAIPLLGGTDAEVIMTFAIDLWKYRLSGGTRLCKAVIQIGSTAETKRRAVAIPAIDVGRTWISQILEVPSDEFTEDDIGNLWQLTRAFPPSWAQLESKLIRCKMVKPTREDFDKTVRRFRALATLIPIVEGVPFEFQPKGVKDSTRLRQLFATGIITPGAEPLAIFAHIKVRVKHGETLTTLEDCIKAATEQFAIHLKMELDISAARSELGLQPTVGRDSEGTKHEPTRTRAAHDSTAYCSHHKRFGHSTEQCHAVQAKAGRAAHEAPREAPTTTEGAKAAFRPASATAASAAAPISRGKATAFKCDGVNCATFKSPHTSDDCFTLHPDKLEEFLRKRKARNSAGVKFDPRGAASAKPTATPVSVALHAIEERTLIPLIGGRPSGKFTIGGVEVDAILDSGAVNTSVTRAFLEKHETALASYRRAGAVSLITDFAGRSLLPKDPCHLSEIPVGFGENTSLEVVDVTEGSSPNIVIGWRTLTRLAHPLALVTIPVVAPEKLIRETITGIADSPLMYMTVPTEEIPEDTRKALGDLVSRTVPGLDRDSAIEFERISMSRAAAFGNGWTKERGFATGVPPFSVKIDPMAKPVMIPEHRMSHFEEQLAEESVTVMISMGAAKLSDTIIPEAAPAFTLKQRGGKRRLVISEGAHNAREITDPYTFPTILGLIAKVAGCSWFFKSDFVRGYWQIPSDEETARLCAFRIGVKCYLALGMPMGNKNSPAHFQRCVEMMLGPLLGKEVEAYIDDLLGHGTTIQNLLITLDKLLERIIFHHMLLSPEKTFLGQMLSWCSLQLSPKGVGPSPDKIAALLRMPYPVTAAVMHSFLGGAGWFRNFIPQFAALVRPLDTVLQEAQARTTKRTRSQMARQRIKWTPELIAAYDLVRRAIANATMNAFRDPAMRLVLLTDSSWTDWATQFTQIKPEAVDLPLAEQGHQPLLFGSGHWSSNQLQWSILDKEAAAVVTALDKAYFLAHNSTAILLYVDNGDLAALLSCAKQASRGNIAVDARIAKLMEALSRYWLEVRWIPSSANLWTDMLSRQWSDEWTANPGMEVTKLPSPLAVITQSIEEIENLVMAVDSSMAMQQMLCGQVNNPVVPSRTEIDAASLGMPIPADPHGDGEARAFLPDSAATLPLRIRIIAIVHAGTGLHHTADRTWLLIDRAFYGDGLRNQVAVFCKGCLVCAMAGGRTVIPRAWGLTLVPTKRNAIVYADFFSMPPEYVDGVLLDHILILKDAFSHFVWLHPCGNPAAHVVVKALLAWAALFSLPETLQSDRGSHFRNTIVKALTELLHVGQHFTTAHCPKANGAIERVGLDLRAISVSLQVQLVLGRDTWHVLVPIINDVLNSRPSESLAGHAPREIMVGLPPTTALTAILHPNASVVSVDVNKPDIQAAFSKLVADLDELSAPVTAAQAHRRDINARHREAHSRRIDFDIGDFVLRADVREHLPNNTIRWSGPFRVVDMLNDRVYVIEDIVTLVRTEQHAERLRRFRSGEALLLEQWKEVAAHSTQGFILEAILSASLDDSGRAVFEAKWLGLIHTSLETSEFLLDEDPALLSDFIVQLLSQDIVTLELRNQLQAIMHELDFEEGV